MPLAEDVDAIRTVYTSGRSPAPLIVDVSDYEMVTWYKWYIARGYAKTDIGYGRSGRRTLKLHQYIMGRAPDGLEWDHINRDKLDNRRVNLRLVTHAQNLRNRGARGVSRRKGTNLWEAYIGVGNRIKKNLGLYRTEGAAIEARRVAEVTYWGTNESR